MSNPKKFRPNVAAIIRNAEGRILICERMRPAGAWQFPQGGISRGETPEEALVREVHEEVALKAGDFRILESRGPYRYLFKKHRKGFHGQEQQYFLLELMADPSRINVATEAQEFRAVRWIYPEEFDMNWVPDFKKEVYKAVFRDFFSISA